MRPPWWLRETRPAVAVGDSLCVHYEVSRLYVAWVLACALAAHIMAGVRALGRRLLGGGR